MDYNSHMLSFLLTACVIGAIVYYVNFSSSSSSIAQNIHGEITLQPDEGKLHILVTGGAGFIGSHATMLLTQAGHAVTVVDNLSRGNLGAVVQLSSMTPKGKFKFLYADLGDKQAVCALLAEARPRIDLVMHFAAVAYVGEGARMMHASALRPSAGPDHARPALAHAPGTLHLALAPACMAGATLQACDACSSSVADRMLA